MSWLPRLSLKRARSRLQFVKDAPGIQARQTNGGLLDARRIAQLADAVSSLRQERNRERKTGRGQT
jgi:hypothetical protein